MDYVPFKRYTTVCRTTAWTMCHSKDIQRYAGGSLRLELVFEVENVWKREACPWGTHSRERAEIIDCTVK